MTERTIFLQALERERGEARSAFLDEACGADSSLRQRVESLLRSHVEAGSFLGVPAMGQPGATEAAPGRATEALPPVDGVGEVDLDFLAPSDKPESLGRLDHYEVLAVVGRGGMGVVLRAFDEKLHRVVALKVMVREIAGSGAARKRFSREAKAAAAVVHDHIVPIHAIEESGPTPYLVMQYIDGQSLQQKIDAEGSLELKEILRIGIQMAAGLAAAHKQGLVHRDIKPSNILLENGVQRVKITDFGLARAADDSSMTQPGVVAGTPQYMSPEQADGQPIDHRSDLFSLGGVLYAMCTGRPPFRAASTVATLKRVCEDTPRPIRELNPDLPPWLPDIIDKLHAKLPAERFQSAKEVAEVLERHLADAQWPCAPAMRALPARRTKAVAAPKVEKWRHRLATAAMCLLLLFVGAFVTGAEMYAKSVELSLRGQAVNLADMSAARGQTAAFNAPAPTPAGDPANAIDLQNLVTLQENAVGRARSRAAAGLASAATVAAAEADLIEAQIRLAETQGITDAIGPLLSQSVWKREELLAHAKALFAAGQTTFDDVNLAERSVFEARLRRSKQDSADGFVPLFNGNDLTGWEGMQGYWEWRVDSLVGSNINRPNRFHTQLCSLENFKDFELRAQVWLKDDLGNSGILFRSTITDRTHFTVKGPQVDIGRGVWGNLFAEDSDGLIQAALPAVVARAVKKNDFNEIDLKCVSRRIRIQLNGHTVVDGDFPKVPLDGRIAFQLCAGDAVQVLFRNVEIRKLLVPDKVD